MPSPEQRRKIKSQFKIMSVPYNVVRMDYSRGARHGQTQWQSMTIGRQKMQIGGRKKHRSHRAAMAK